MADEVIAQGTLQLVVDINQAQVEAAVEDISRNITNKLVKAAEGGEAAFKKLGEAAKAVAKTIGAIGAVGGAAAVGLATKTVRAGVEFNVLQQKVRAALTTILGTAAAAETLLAQVNLLNDSSPFSRASFLEATQQLIGFGVEADKIVGILDSVQQAVAGIGGDENDILRISSAFAKIASSGKLTGDVLLTLQEKGIDAAGLLGKQWGVTAAEIRDQTSRGMIGAEKAIDGLVLGLQDKFGGATENAAVSLGTALDRLSSRIRNIGADITKPFINPFGGGLAIDIINNITKALDNIRKNVIPTLIPIIKSVGEEVKRLSEGFVRFTASIDTEQVQKVLEVFRFLLPVVAGLGVALAKSFSSGIPFIGPLLGALNGPLLVIVALAAVVPEFRQVLLDLGEALQPLVEALLPLLADTIKSLAIILGALVPVLGVVVTGIRFLVNGLAPLINFSSGFGLLNAALALFIARLVVVRQLGGGGLGLGQVKDALLGLASPLNVAIIGFTTLAARLADNQSKAKAFASTFTKGIDTNNFEDLEAAMAGITAAGEKAQAAANKGLLSGGPLFNIFGSDAARKAADNAKLLREELDRLQEVKGFRAGLFAEVREAIPGKQSVEKLNEVVEALGIRFEDLTATNLPIKVKEIVKEFGRLAETGEVVKDKFIDVLGLLDSLAADQKNLTAATKDYQTALQGVLKAQEDVNTAIREGAEAVADAIEAANEANDAAIEAAAEATTSLVDAQTKLAELIAEGGEEELAKARESVADATERVADATDRQADAAERLAKLLEPATEQELANAVDNVTSATISLARATRKRDEALKALNESQQESIDLSGLSLDGLKSTLANARASAAAQRAVNKTGKTHEELQEDAVLAEIGVRDATQNVTEAKKTLRDLELKGLVETPQITAARKDLAGADRDVAEAIRDQTTKRAALNLIESGVSQFSKDLKTAREGVAEAEGKVAKANEEVGRTAEEGQERVAKAHEDANERIVAARDTVVDAEDRVTAALYRQRDAQQAINEKVATAISDQDTLLTSKLNQFTANEDLIRQTPGLLESAIANVIALLPPLQSPGGGHGAPGATQRQQLIKGIGDLMRDPRLPFAEAFKRLGILGYGAEGALIKGSPGPLGQLMHVGEFGKPELLLPLTKPNRVWELLSKNLPKYPGAMAAAQTAILPNRPAPARLSIVGSGGAGATSKAQRQANKELAQAIAAELVAAGIGQGESTTNVTIPVTTPVPDPRLLARDIERKIRNNRRR